MLRLLTRQVTDPRDRTPKSLAVADIEPTRAPGARPHAAVLGVHTLRLCVCRAGDREQLIAGATSNPTVPAGQAIWRFVFEALAAALKAQTGAKGDEKDGGRTTGCASGSF